MKYASRTISILNSPFFLWLLSVFVLSIGGTYFAARDTCVREADEIVDRYNKLTAEIRSRQRKIIAIVYEAKDIADVRAKIGVKNENFWHEFREVSLEELTWRINQIKRRTINPPISWEMRDVSRPELLSMTIEKANEERRARSFFSLGDVRGLDGLDLSQLRTRAVAVNTEMTKDVFC